MNVSWDDCPDATSDGCQRPPVGLCRAVARGGSYCLGGGGSGSRTGSRLILARIAFKVFMRVERK
jgi:hypothetical protein